MAMESKHYMSLKLLKLVIKVITVCYIARDTGNAANLISFLIILKIVKRTFNTDFKQVNFKCCDSKH